MKTVTVLNAKGKRRDVAVAAIEVPLGDGRSLVLSFPESAHGEIEIAAQADGASAVILVQPAAANLIRVHVLAERSAPQAPAKLELSVQKVLAKGHKSGVPSKTQLRQWVLAALGQDAELTLRFVGEEESQALNRDYRGKDAPTNVLSFPYATTPQLLGDLVLCWPVVQAEAAAQGKSLEAHCAHLVVHGTLHLQGLDHESEAEAEAMEALEQEILARLGYPDPYAEPA